MIRSKTLVDFDPENPEHVASIKSTLDNERLDSNFRFHIDPEMAVNENGKPSPRYSSVLGMALFKMAYKYMALMEQQTGTSTDAEQNSSHAARSVVRQLPMRQLGQQVQIPIVGLPGRIEQNLDPKGEIKKLH